MTVIDIILALCFIPAIIHGISKGFLHQMAGITAIVAGLWAVFTYKDSLSAQLGSVFNLSHTALIILAIAIILLAVALIFSLIGSLLTKIASLIAMGWLNRILGVIFSVLLTAFILGLLIMLFDSADAKFHILKPEATANSPLYQCLRDLGYNVFPYIKKLIP